MILKFLLLNQVFISFFSIIKYNQNILVTIKYKFLIVLIFHKLLKFKPSISTSYDNVYFKYRM